MAFDSLSNHSRMSIPAPDPQTFHWIKGALDGSMDAVMSQVLLAEQDEDYGQLTTVPGNLHQINGSLRMVELEAAGMLAEDLESLCRQLCAELEDGQLPDSDREDGPGLGILRRGLEALQAYIDAISRQTPVSPLALVDQINVIRKAIHKDPVSRFDLFDPPLTLLDLEKLRAANDGPVDEADTEEESERRRFVPDDMRVRLVTQLRRKYRRALVSWLANRRKKGGSRLYLGKINDLLRHLFRISSLDISQQLWWVAGGFVDAVAEGDLDADTRIKSQFAQLDIEISRLEEENTAPIAVDPPDQLLRQLLFFIGEIEEAESERVREIQSALRLSEWFDQDDSRYRQLVDTSEALRRLGERFPSTQFELLETSINDYFGDLLEQQSADPNQVLGFLQQLADASNETGPTEFGDLLQRLSAAIVNTQKHPDALVDTQADIKIASALLFIKDSIAHPDTIDASWRQSVDSHGDELSDLASTSRADNERALRVRRVAKVEYQHARSAVASQIREILGNVEKLLGAGVPEGSANETNLTTAALRESAEAVLKIARVLDVAQAELATEVAGRLSACLAYFANHPQPTQNQQLEIFAFGVAALGLATDQLSRRGPEADNVLRTALNRLEQVPVPDLFIQNAAANGWVIADDGFDDESSDAELSVNGDDFPDAHLAAIASDTDPADDEQPRPALDTLIDELEYQRRQLSARNLDGVRGLMKGFESLAVEDEVQASMRQLAVMGQSICRNLLENDTDVTPEKRDFIGLLVRQLRDLAKLDDSPDGSIADSLDLDAWRRRVVDLTNSDVVSVQDVDAYERGSEQISDFRAAIDSPDESDLVERDAEQEQLDPVAEQIADTDVSHGGRLTDHDRDQEEVPDLFSDDVGNSALLPGLVQLDLDLRRIFVEEFGSHLQKLRTELDTYRSAKPESVDAISALSEIDDCVHTLSGNCRNLGFDDVAECAESAATALGDDRAVDRNARIAFFAESLIILGASRLEIKDRGEISPETQSELGDYLARSRGFSNSSPSGDDESPSYSPITQSLELDPVISERTADRKETDDAPRSGTADTGGEPGEALSDRDPMTDAQTVEQSPVDADSITDTEAQIDEEIREIFIEESVSILSRVNAHLQSWRENGPGAGVLAAVRREFHTLKGSAAATGFGEISALSHRIETLLEDQPADLSQIETTRVSKMIELLEEVHDGLAADLGAMEAGAKGHIPDLDRRLDSFLDDTSGMEPEQEAEPMKLVSVGDRQVHEIDTTANRQTTGRPKVSALVTAESESVSTTAKVENSDRDAADTDAITNTDNPDQKLDEDMDDEIRRIFIEESASILGRINGHLLRWRDAGLSNDVLAGVRREFHTLKGSAAASGYDDISMLSHRIESLLEDQPMDLGEIAPSMWRKVLGLLEEVHDGLTAELGLMATDASNHLPNLDRKIDLLLGIHGSESVAAAGDANASGKPVEVAGIEDESETGEPLSTEAAAETEDVNTENSGDDASNRNWSASDPDDGAGVVAEAEALIASGLSLTDDFDEAGVATTFGHPPSISSAESEENEALSWMPDEPNEYHSSRAGDEGTSGSMLRIGNTKLAQLINTSGELSLVRSQLQDTLDATRMDLDVLRTSMSSMRAGLRDLELEADAQIRARPESQNIAVADEFDPLQLDRYSGLQAKSREVTELLDQLAKVERDLDSRASNLDGALRQQLHLGDQLQSGLMSARMVSMGEYLPRLRYLVRETSRQANKPVEFVFRGGDIQVDRQVIEAMMAPFEHMIRNAVAHGIENPEDRRAAGKPESGTVTLSLSQQGSELAVGFSDDGAGLDLDRLNTRAVELGLAENTGRVTDVDLLQVITQPGYSTAGSLTMESGRGVGMDVVYQAVRDLGGSMTLSHWPQKGVSFQFRLPVTLALTQALLVKVAGWRFAIRSRTIERLMRVAVSDVFELDGENMVVVDGQNVILYSIRERLGMDPQTTDASNISVVLVRLADRLAAVQVDEFVDSVNIVSKSCGKQLASIPENIRGHNPGRLLADSDTRSRSICRSNCTV